jgi:predicted DNA-binding WGR domain protein
MEYEFIGWCKDEQENTDKVWGVIKLRGDHWGGSYVSFWGRRGKKLQTKTFTHTSDWEMTKHINTKRKKGYQSVNKSRLDVVYPEFEKDLEQTAVWAMLTA